MMEWLRYIVSTANEYAQEFQLSRGALVLEFIGWMAVIVGGFITSAGLLIIAGDAS